MTIQEIINTLIENTDWNLLFTLKTIAHCSKYPNSPIERFEDFKERGIKSIKELSAEWFTNGKTLSTNSGYLTVYKSPEEGLFNYGIKFEVTENLLV